MLYFVRFRDTSYLCDQTENWISRNVWPHRQIMAANVMTEDVMLQVLSGQTHLEDTTFVQLGWMARAIYDLRA